MKKLRNYFWYIPLIIFFIGFVFVRAGLKSNNYYGELYFISIGIILMVLSFSIYLINRYIQRKKNKLPHDKKIKLNLTNIEIKDKIFEDETIGSTIKLEVLLNKEIKKPISIDFPIEKKNLEFILKSQKELMFHYNSKDESQFYIDLNFLPAILSSNTIIILG